MIYIVIPVFNRKEFTEDCLVSLNSQTYKDFKVIVVDDGSTDGTAEMITEKFPDVDILYGDGNLFWTASVNMGIRHALKKGARLIMTLNNDVIAPESFLEKMIFHHKLNPQAMLGALAVDANSGKAIYGGERLEWSSNKTISLLQVLTTEQQKGLHEVSYFPGRGLLIPQVIFDKIGLFDEKRFPHYFADYDFSSQARLHGFKVYCNYDSKLLTYPDESGDRKNRKKKSLKNYMNHLFGIKGGGNLINFTRFAFRNCPPIFIPYYLLNGYARRIFGYLIK